MIKSTLLYIMDPLCGWCYGFSPVIMELYKKYKKEIEFKVIPGGMVTGKRIQPVAIMADYILDAYKKVENFTGVKFGEPYLDMLKEGNEISNSEPPCRAIHTFSTIDKNNTLAYTHSLQQKLFREGKSMNEENTYRELAKEFGIDPNSFVEKWNSDECKYGIQQHFQWVRAANITGFPCTILQHNEEYYLIASGYRNYKDLEIAYNNARDVAAMK